MDILFLGGTRFVGRHLVTAALERGHRPTLFHRGRTGVEVHPEVERILGDRDGGLDALGGREFDAVVDVSGYLPRLVRDSATRLRGAAERYLFISSMSVLAYPGPPGQDEDSPLAVLDDPKVERIDAATYGGLKVLCEEAVSEIWGGSSLILRPGYIVGPDDHTDRFTAWLRRVAAGGDFIAPGPPEGPIQWIDARDLAGFAIDGLERQLGGVFTVTGPAERSTWSCLFAEMERTFGAGSRPCWVDPAFIAAHSLGGRDLPLWHPPDRLGLHRLSNDRAIGAGLVHRPEEETFRDTLAWDRRHGVLAESRAPDSSAPCGLGPDRERELLTAART